MDCGMEATGVVGGHEAIGIAFNGWKGMDARFIAAMGIVAKQAEMLRQSKATLGDFKSNFIGGFSDDC